MINGKGNGDWEGRKYLCTTISWDWCPSVVPQTLVGTGDRLLIVIGMRGSKCSTCKQAKRMEQHDDGLNESNLDAKQRNLWKE